MGIPQTAVELKDEKAYGHEDSPERGVAEVRLNAQSMDVLLAMHGGLGQHVTLH